ncbi:uncharacterized protein LOC133517524 [Cydia pomonella]|uniref:uncharacterized protein LOC133517524 n=1 Tax=Cydia pomonella TaxID=82600 RepID=UPI002ADDF660|nr:uncharacterized protein LOC133517524 [Cydia pomonella]
MSPTPPTPQTTTIELSAISLAAKIPDFWQDQPRLWFLQVEAILAQQKAGDQSNYNMVIAKLGKQAIQQVADILEKPPSENKFDTLKARLLSVYEETEAKRLQQLMSDMELGEQRPSQLLRRMRDLARDKIPDDTLVYFWQGHLPPSVRAVVASAESKNLESLASIADKVMETFKPNEVASIQTTSRQSSPNDFITAELAKINSRISELASSSGRGRSRRRNRSQGRARSRSRNNSRSGRTPNSPDWLCFYHYRYKTKANKCVQPCSWKGQSPTGN